MRENISKTIGAEHEWIIIDNSRLEYSIFSAYNMGVKKASGDICCFMHDDVLFHINGWGRMIEHYFSNHRQVGMVGVAGTHFMPKAPAAWWDSEVLSGHMLQGSTIEGQYKVKEIEWTKHKSAMTAVAAIDGFFMCIPRQLFGKIKWDECFSGFHGYDLDMSYQIWNAGYEIHIVWDILIEHRSMGVVQAAFWEATNAVFNKWQEILPLCKGVTMTIGEQEARTRLVEVKQELFLRHQALKEVYASTSFKIGNKLHSLTHLFHSKNNKL